MEKKFKFNLKNLKKDQLLILLLLGVLLIVIAIPTGNKKSSGTTKEAEGSGTSGSGKAESGQGGYAQALEQRLKSVLQKVNGVGETEVMITLKSSGERVVEKDSPENRNEIKETDSGGGTRTTTDTEKSETTVYENTSDGSSSPYISKEMEPEVEGVIIIAKGGDDPLVKQNITEAVMALFQVEIHKIKVMKMN